MSDITFPAMRDEVIGALQSLASIEHQRRTWGVVEPGRSHFEDLTLVLNQLFDNLVLPDPSRAVGAVIRTIEVDSLDALNAVLSPMIDDLGDAPDAAYMADDRWPAVVQRAGIALAAMEGRGKRAGRAPLGGDRAGTIG